jgi:hypothetical protein
VDHLTRNLDAATLPAGIGSLRIKTKPHLFLWTDAAGKPVIGQASPALWHGPTTTEGLQKPVETFGQTSGTVGRPCHSAETRPCHSADADFAQRFENAFTRLDNDRGAANFVSLVELRRALPVKRAIFDAGLEELRRTGRYTLTGAEGRHGVSDEEREAAVREDGALLLYVSRRLS